MAWALCAAWSRRETGRPGGRPPRRPCSPRGRAELRTGRRGGPAPGRQMIQTFMGRYLRTGTPQSDVIARKNKPALTENSFPVFSPPRSLLNGRFWQVPAAGNCQQGAASRDQSQQHGNGTRSVRGTGTPPTGTRVRLRPPPSAAPPPRAAGAWSWPPCRWLRAPTTRLTAPGTEDGRPRGRRPELGLRLRWAPPGWGESPPALLAPPPSSHVTP